MRPHILHPIAAKPMWIVALVVVVAAAGAGVAFLLTSGSGSGYRTATATTGNVMQTVDGVGTLAPVNQAKLDFQVSGQVAAVSVSVGQQVREGDVLATLDSSSLTSSVDAAQSAITSGNQKLTADEESETSGGAPSATPDPPASAPSAPGSSSDQTAITAAQAALTTDQQTSDTASTQAKADLAQAATKCASSTDASASGSPSNASSGSTGTNGTPAGADAGAAPTSTTTDPPTSTTTSPSADPSGSGTGGSTVTGTASGDNAAACASGLQQELADQQKVSQDQQQVAQDESKLAKDLSAAGNAAGKSEPASNGAGQSPAGQGSASTSGASLASSVATPYQLAADQATLDADEAQLSEAQANLDEGQLVSPIDGVVASVGVSVGQTISADSSADQIVVIGPQTFQVTTPVGVSDLSDVHVGATAMVVPNGQSGSLRGQVTEVGPPPTSTSSTSYPVVVSVPAGSAGLYDGATTNVSIVVGQASNVVTVPTSAVHVLGRVAFVSELRNGSVVTVPVTTGLIGDTVTQLTTGLKPGAVVVLANLSEPLPTSTGLSGVGALLGGGGRVRFAPGGVGGAVPSGSVSITGKSS